MKKYKVHKYIHKSDGINHNQTTCCGYYGNSGSTRWIDVNCKNCLRDKW